MWNGDFVLPTAVSVCDVLCVLFPVLCIIYVCSFCAGDGEGICFDEVRLL